jgi:hypothetical protein
MGRFGPTGGVERSVAKAVSVVIPQRPHIMRCPSPKEVMSYDIAYSEDAAVNML